MKKDLDPLLALCRELEIVKSRAAELGIFIDDRELLECENCGLFEDVTVSGILITRRDSLAKVSDSGLRFSETTPGVFVCPSCGFKVKIPKESTGD
ncbi:MAG: hypothetical protein P1U89_23995 [Verrucomicrobiales bacterium]|nr:hypothetical protein [Verrucomicrobiales bacterium]